MSTLGRADEDDDDGDDDDGDSIDDDGDDGGEVNGAHRVPQPNVRLDGGQSRSSGRAKHLQHIDYFIHCDGLIKLCPQRIRAVLLLLREPITATKSAKKERTPIGFKFFQQM